MKTTKDFYEQTLRQLMSSLSEKEVQESLKQNEKKHTLKFNTCMLFLIVVKSTTTTWKNIYGLQKPSEFVVHGDDKDGEDVDVEEEVEIRDDEIDDEEEGQEETKESIPEIQSIEGTDVEKNATLSMTSFPHSPRKALV